MKHADRLFIFLGTVDSCLHQILFPCSNPYIPVCVEKQESEVKLEELQLIEGATTLQGAESVLLSTLTHHTQYS